MGAAASPAESFAISCSRWFVDSTAAEASIVLVLSAASKVGVENLKISH